MPPFTRRPAAIALVVLIAVAASPRATSAQRGAAPSGTRASGVALGPHAVGFDVIQGIDRTRRINALDDGVRIGIARWYPTAQAARPRPAMRSIDYRLLPLAAVPTPAERQAFEEDDVDMLVAWLHAGIVPMTREQARQTMYAPGIAVRDAAPAGKGWPVICVLGGPWYFSTTAEVLASHGFVVIAPFRYRDQADDASAPGAYLENSVRDAEWALDRLRTDPLSDVSRVGVLGHGGGGMQAMVLAMRSRLVKAVVNVDAGNFSTRTGPGRVPSYSVRSLRAPYLFIATAQTRTSLDLFDDFVAMRFSTRSEIVLGDDRIRHHDLSDVGRAVTAPLGIRGAAQADVQDSYAFVQAAIVRFVREHVARDAPATPRFADAVEALRGRLSVALTERPAVEPAPTAVELGASLGRDTVATLAAARARDPEAPVFEEGALSGLVGLARAKGGAEASALARFGLDVHPRSAVLLDQASAVAERDGDRAFALSTATTCSGLRVENDWRAAGAIRRCQDRVQRLEGQPPR